MVALALPGQIRAFRPEDLAVQRPSNVWWSTLMPGTWWAQPPLQVPLPADGARGLALLATGAQSCFVWLGRS